jgi:RND superfamily putative drug exporter
VLLDALLVRLMLARLMLVPILLRLTGRAAWGPPRWLDRLLPDLRFGH